MNREAFRVLKGYPSTIELARSRRARLPGIGEVGTRQAGTAATLDRGCEYCGYLACPGGSVCGAKAAPPAPPAQPEPASGAVFAVGDVVTPKPGREGAALLPGIEYRVVSVDGNASVTLAGDFDPSFSGLTMWFTADRLELVRRADEKPKPVAFEKGDIVRLVSDSPEDAWHGKITTVMRVNGPCVVVEGGGNCHRDFVELVRRAGEAEADVLPPGWRRGAYFTPGVTWESGRERHESYDHESGAHVWLSNYGYRVVADSAPMHPTRELAMAAATGAGR